MKRQNIDDPTIISLTLENARNCAGAEVIGIYLYTPEDFDIEPEKIGHPGDFREIPAALETPSSHHRIPPHWAPVSQIAVPMRRVAC